MVGKGSKGAARILCKRLAVVDVTNTNHPDV